MQNCVAPKIFRLYDYKPPLQFFLSNKKGVFVLNFAPSFKNFFGPPGYRIFATKPGLRIDKFYSSSCFEFIKILQVQVRVL